MYITAPISGSLVLISVIFPLREFWADTLNPINTKVKVNNFSMFFLEIFFMDDFINKNEKIICTQSHEGFKKKVKSTNWQKIS